MSISSRWMKGCMSLEASQAPMPSSVSASKRACIVFPSSTPFLKEQVMSVCVSVCHSIILSSSSEDCGLDSISLLVQASASPIELHIVHCFRSLCLSSRKLYVIHKIDIQFIDFVLSSSLHGQKGKGQAGQTVFIHGGSGGVGIAAIQLARAHGMTVSFE